MQNAVTSGFALLDNTGCIEQAPRGTTTLHARVDSSGSVDGTVWLSVVD
jgi:hypothetical protein